MSSTPIGHIINLNDTTPIARSGRRLALWQSDANIPIASVSAEVANYGGVNATITASTATLGQAQQGTINKYSNASGIAVTVDPTSMDAEWMCYVINIGTAGTITFTGSSGTWTFGSVTGAADFTLGPGADAIIFWDGTNWVAAMAGGGGGTGVTSLNSLAGALSITGGAGVVVTPSGSTVQVSLSGSGPSPAIRRWAYASAAGIALGNAGSFVGDSFPGTNLGAYNAPNGSTTIWPYTNYQTPATSGQSSGTSGSRSWRYEANLLFQTKIQISQLTACRLVIGFGDTTSAVTWASSDTLTANYCAFRFSTNASDTDWQCITGNGATATVTSSGIAVATATDYLFQIQCNPAIPNVIFSINGSVVLTTATTLPTTGINLGMQAVIQTLANAAKNWFGAYYYLEADY